MKIEIDGVTKLLYREKMNILKKKNPDKLIACINLELPTFSRCLISF